MSKLRVLTPSYWINGFRYVMYAYRCMSGKDEHSNKIQFSMFNPRYVNELMTQENEFGVPIIPCGYTTVSNGVAFAAMTMSTYNGKEVPTAIVDMMFEKLSEPSQRFLIYHELGHLKYGHSVHQVSGKEYAAARIRGEYMEEELAADAYAASIVGKEAGYKALKESMRVGGFAVPETKEMRIRLKALQH